MPGRLTIAVILLFFAGMLGWQWHRNFGTTFGEGPQLKPSLELAAEDGTTKWVMMLNQERLGDAETVVNKTSMGVFLLKQNVVLDGDLEKYMGPMGIIARQFGVKLNEFRAFIKTDMELTYLGTLRKMNMTFTTKVRPVLTTADLARERASAAEAVRKGEKDETNPLMRMTVSAEVHQVDHLTLKGNFMLAGAGFPIEEMSVKYRNTSTLFSNMAPTDCMAGIRLGQRWQMPVIDPTQLMQGAVFASKAKELSNGAFNADDMIKTKVVEVKVLDELRELVWNGQRIPCFVAQSIEKGSKMQIWVNASNYRVLKQSIESDRHLFELIREPKKEE